MSAIAPFSLQASVECPGDVGLAPALAAADFRRVDTGSVERSLDVIAEEAHAAQSSPCEPSRQPGHGDLPHCLVHVLEDLGRRRFTHHQSVCRSV